MKNLLKSQRGMSLVEILIVIALIAVVMTTLGRNIMGRFRTGNIKTTKIRIQKVIEAVKEFEMICSQPFPDRDDALKILVDKPNDLSCSEYPMGGFLMQADLKDAFGKELIFRRNNGKPEVISVGLSNGDPDGVDAISSENLGL